MHIAQIYFIHFHVFVLLNLLSFSSSLSFFLAFNYYEFWKDFNFIIAVGSAWFCDIACLHDPCVSAQLFQTTFLDRITTLFTTIDMAAIGYLFLAVGKTGYA